MNQNQHKRNDRKKPISTGDGEVSRNLTRVLFFTKLMETEANVVTPPGAGVGTCPRPCSPPHRGQMMGVTSTAVLASAPKLGSFPLPVCGGGCVNMFCAMTDAGSNDTNRLAQTAAWLGLTGMSPFPGHPIRDPDGSGGTTVCYQHVRPPRGGSSVCELVVFQVETEQLGHWATAPESIKS